MKYFKAILYTVLMSFIFFSVLIFAEGITRAQKMIKIINNALEEDNYHILLRGNYQNPNSVFEVNLETEDFKLRVLGFETSSIIDDEVSNYLELVIIAEEGEMSQFIDIETSLKTNGNEIELWLIKYLNLEVYTTVINDNHNELLTIDKLFEKGNLIQSFAVGYARDDGEFKETSVQIDLNQEEFKFSETINNYYTTNNAYPEEDTNLIKLSQEVEIKTGTTLIVTGAILLVLIGLLTFYVYSVRPKRKLGKSNPSKNLEKDLERVRK